MLAQNKLCAVTQVYARSERFMRDEMKLYTFRTIYARRNEIIRAQYDLCAEKRQ